MNDPIFGLTLNYRDVERTVNCVRSLLNQGIERIWVCDNSEDGGQSANLLRASFKKETRVVVWENGINLGFAAGVNLALESIRGEHSSCFVLVINNDAYLLPGGLRVLREALVRHREAVLLYPLVREKKTNIGLRYYQRWLGLVTNFPLSGSFRYPTGCALLISLKNASFPIFDEDFFMYGEDTMLGWRLRTQKAMIFVPTICVEHESSASSQMGSFFYETRVVAAHWILARKLAERFCERMVMYAGRLGVLPVRAILRALRFRSWLPFQALYEGWRLAFLSDPTRDRARSYLAARRHLIQHSIGSVGSESWRKPCPEL